MNVRTSTKSRFSKCPKHDRLCFGSLDPPLIHRVWPTGWSRPHVIATAHRSFLRLNVRLKNGNLGETQHVRGHRSRSPYRESLKTSSASQKKFNLHVLTIHSACNTPTRLYTPVKTAGLSPIFATISRKKQLARAIVANNPISKATV